jgi:hypothetical protein
MGESMLESFNGDNYIAKRITELIAKHDIKSVFETGTYQGQTTKWFIEFNNRSLTVITAEVNQTLFKHAETMFSHKPNVRVIGRSSHEAIMAFASTLKPRVLFYLDAHWYEYNPLLDELDAIGRLVQNGLIQTPVIAIHDWKVEGTQLGFDYYDKGKTQPYSDDFISKYLEMIYRGKMVVSHNTDVESAGAKRGIIYIEPVI